MPTENSNKDLQAHFYEQLSSQFNKCLDPTMQCKKKAIRAHSVQNSRFLDLLCKDGDGHVVQLQLHFENRNFPKIVFKSIGRNKATTFTGLCSEHDRSIFEQIDTKAIDGTDEQQLFLLVYRAVLRQLHTTMNGAVGVQGAYQKRVELGVDPKGESSPAGIEAAYHMAKSWFTFRYKCKYDDISENVEYSRILHVTRLLDTTQPTIAASVFFGVEKDPDREDTKGIILNILPLEPKKTLVVISYLAEHRAEAEAELSDILLANGYYLKYLISRILLKRGENFVIAPEYFESWPKKKAEKIAQYFQKTMFDSSHDEESEYLYLF